MNYDGKTERFFGDVVARYEKRFMNDRLGLNAMVGASQEMYRSKNFSATKYDMIDLSLNVIDAAIGDATASGSSTEWAMRSFFGRINLDWENKYLLEVNLRADQSSRFLSNTVPVTSLLLPLHGVWIRKPLWKIGWRKD